MFVHLALLWPLLALAIIGLIDLCHFIGNAVHRIVGLLSEVWDGLKFLHRKPKMETVELPDEDSPTVFPGSGSWPKINSH